MLGVLPTCRSRSAVSKTGLGLVRSVLVAEIWSIYWFEVVVVGVYGREEDEERKLLLCCSLLQKYECNRTGWVVVE